MHCNNFNEMLVKGAVPSSNRKPLKKEQMIPLFPLKMQLLFVVLQSANKISLQLKKFITMTVDEISLLHLFNFNQRLLKFY